MGDRELKKPHFVFIHGAGGGSWCWYNIKCLMYNSGYTVTCIDLKGTGIDPSDPSKILSFDAYNKPLIDFLSSLLDHEHVVLVGHSAGGLSVTDASCKFPEKISLTVYIAATMLKVGFSTPQDIKDRCDSIGYLLKEEKVVSDQNLFRSSANFLFPSVCGRLLSLPLRQRRKGEITYLYLLMGVVKASVRSNLKGEPDVSEFGDVYDFKYGSGPSQPPTGAIVKKEFQGKLLYNMSPLEDFTLAAMLLRPAPVYAFQRAEFKEGKEGVEKVPRVYIKMVYDRVVKPEQQERMITK
ncbi:hypothetical protein L1987_24916 [Smallanthus sonchifolius]|uniref:Uncharacterized protein n=1 Tax=Smallanthus sonchifolius TaxID=185202 RepID=A0ACB9IN41_9ASTR|nr:hypothetical protein L1987_24916 [Smallanthus sonchifolius]